MQAIRTRYLGPTNRRDARISVSCEAARIIVPWDDRLDTEENHIAAREVLVRKLGWDEKYYAPMVTGCFQGDYYHVFGSVPRYKMIRRRRGR
jgi:hypothetical protein